MWIKTWKNKQGEFVKALPWIFLFLRVHYQAAFTSLKLLFRYTTLPG